MLCYQILEYDHIFFSVFFIAEGEGAFKKTWVVPAISNFCGIPVLKVLRVLHLKVELMSNFQGQLIGTENKQCLQFSCWHLTRHCGKQGIE